MSDWESTLGFFMVFDFADKGLIAGMNVNPARMNVILQANRYDDIDKIAVYWCKTKDLGLFTYFSKDEDFQFV